MAHVSIDEIQRDLQGYLQRVEAGETLVICQNDLPVAEMTPVKNVGGKQRPFGLCAGEFDVPDDFDAPLPPETVSEFEGM
jgi:antitoxin (DNA-binding transcriptional repressor) of toxin-antitoxin stability system